MTHSSHTPDSVPTLTEQLITATATEKKLEPPILTDVVEPPSVQDAAKNRIAWNDLEYRLTARVLQHVQDRMHVMLDTLLKERVAQVLSTLTEQLLTDVKADLDSTLEVIIAHAISEEMLRLQRTESQTELNPPEPVQNQPWLKAGSF